MAGPASQNNASLDFFFRNFDEAFSRRSVDPKEKDYVDITGWEASEIVGLLKSIVNCSDYVRSSRFTFEIKNENGKSELFRLRPIPTRNQPGNGLLTHFHRDNKTEKEEKVKDTTYNQLTVCLQKEYGEDTTPFAQHIKKVFKDNKEIFNVPEATASIYMLLLFEIGRRLKKDSTSELDKLPITSAIEKLVKLLEAGRCSFEEVFLKGRRLHCFSDDPAKREAAIKKINDEYDKGNYRKSKETFKDDEELDSVTEKLGSVSLKNK